MPRSPTTQARPFSPQQLADLPAQGRQQLCHALLVESGCEIREVLPQPEFVDFLISTTPIWRARSSRVRLMQRALQIDDVQRLADVASENENAEAVLIEGVSQRVTAASTGRVMVVRAAAFIDRLLASALIDWTDAGPVVSRDLFSYLRQREALLTRLDAVGLRWLPWLGRNKIPPPLSRAGGIADSLLELATFRTFVMVFGFSGERQGAKAPGSVAPDSLLYFPDGRHAAVLDCKAARDGYRMDRSDFRALLDYVRDARPRAKAAGRDLAFVMVVSSSFHGGRGRTHPYYGRANRIRDEGGVDLVYISVDDLVRFGLRLEEGDVGPAERAKIDWTAICGAGIPNAATFEAQVP